LLLQIMGNIRPYYKGRCILSEHGMMRSKRFILPHVFYIGNSSMVYNNMNVLEFLMFAMARNHEDKVQQQERLFEFLIDIGLGKISLTPIYSLPKEYKAVIVLLVSAYSDSQLVIYNFPEYHYNRMLLDAMAEIAKRMMENGKALVIATTNCDLIETVCSHTAFLYNGAVVFHGTVEEFQKTYDSVILTLWDKEAEQIAERLKILLPQYRYEVMEDCLKVRNYGSVQSDPRLVYNTVIDAGFSPRKVSIDPKNVWNACEEITRRYDI
ncbi:MAG: hypothetical protein PHT34_06085, partial [Oscillospiraceae bacterium]|nr:hypothetical protein [Oscillospiraceae bacterium]